MTLVQNIIFLIFSLLLFNACNARESGHSKVEIPAVEAGQPLPSDLFIQLAKSVSPSVVSIYTETQPKMNYSEGLPDGYQFLEQFFGLNIPSGRGQQAFPKARPAQSLGTGFVIRNDGLILTNAHVVKDADIIKVLFVGDSKEYKAKVIGADPQTDVALIKISSKKNLPAAKLGTSKTLQVGEWVAAFGNPYGHSNTMTKGIVSALGRDSGELNLFPFIQTDASINPGNSGGPLVNVKGEVIAMNTAIDARAQGIGFAIPIDNVKKILSELEKTGEVQRGFLGVEMQALDEQSAQSIGVPVTEGALIVNVLPKSAAYDAGLKPYDVVTKFGSKIISGPSDLFKAVASTQTGEEKIIEVYRSGKKINLSARIGSKNLESEVQAQNKPKSNSTQSFNLEKLGLKLTVQNAKGLNLRFGSDKKVVIENVKPYSPAFNSGLKPGDLILEVNKVAVNSSADVQRLLQSQNIFRVKRGDRIILLMLMV